MIKYPELCAVWDDNKRDKEVYFDIVVKDYTYKKSGSKLFEGINGALWKHAEPVRDKDPLTFLCNNNLYVDLTEPKIEDDFL